MRAIMWIGWFVGGLALLAAGAAGAVMLSDLWLGWLATSAPRAEENHHAHGGDDEVHVVQQTRDNLELRLERVRLRVSDGPPGREPYPRYIQLLGKVIERPGESDREVIAPFAGTVTSINKVEGEVVQPGDLLFTLQLSGEEMHETQARLYKAALDLKINRQEQQRLRDIKDGESLFRARLLELGFEEQRLVANLDSVRKSVRALLLPMFNHVDGPDPATVAQRVEDAVSQQLAAIETKGQYLTEIEIRASRKRLHLTISASAEPPADRGAAGQLPTSGAPLYEMDRPQVTVGAKVAAGQTLCRLSNHESVYIVGQAFEQDVPLLQRAIERGYGVRADFREGATAALDWPTSSGEGIDLSRLRIVHLSNTIDDRTKTFPFLIRLPNQAKKRVEPDSGRTYLFWRFRVDQPVRLDVQVDEFKDVFVVPAEAVVREGPDTFVFATKSYRATGEVVLRRLPVHVIHEDWKNAVIANDGSVEDDTRIAMNAAAALNRVLKAQKAGAGGGHGHGHSHD